MDDYLFEEDESIFFTKGDLDGELIITAQISLIQCLLEISMYMSDEMFEDLTSLAISP